LVLMIGVEEAKENAAREACRVLGDFRKVKVIGLGTGSTVKKFIDLCIDEIKQYLTVSSSIGTALYTKDTYSVDSVDVYIDGADEVSNKLDLVKGGGGALLREKTLAYLSSYRLYITDYTKFDGRDYLYLKPIPVEITPITLQYAMRAIKNTGLFEPVIRTSIGRDGPVITDNNNYILDLKPLKPIEDPFNTQVTKAYS
jgi:ribose 5-phosphate isomerase A